MYAIIEMQTNDQGVMNVLPVATRVTREEAESVYHSILSFAATSSVAIHSACILNPEGKLIKSECYKHESSAE